ncbi:MAG: hypothetical protein K8R21_04830 [Leptospira sp.]|nr:hypothetical protein [Leptospira sp.]
MAKTANENLLFGKVIYSTQETPQVKAEADTHSIEVYFLNHILEDFQCSPRLFASVP